MEKEILEHILLQDDILTSIKENETKLFEMIPELTVMMGFDQMQPKHHLDVWNHTLKALFYSEPDLEIRLALLFHDIGKPTCYQEKEVRHYDGHSLKSFGIALPIMKRLGYSVETTTRISFLIAYHDEKPSKVRNEMPVELFIKLLKVQYCNALSYHPDYVSKKTQKLDQLIEQFGFKIHIKKR